ncbi:MAG: hypothetical protein C6W58_08925 [Bacillaceae bacterium]|jgi:hypothetical protein|uniref:YphA family membrane protein n=1 Tax=Aeribacillus TaxID=1055323 RepID=UPI000E376681|nr:MAG: hypothetical protein C6W58_08925 [Bacillaceae bacterium]
MEGIYYYWFMWIIWVIVTFWLPKTDARFWLSFFILLNILGSATFIHFTQIHVGFSYILFALLSFFILYRTKRLFYSLFSVLIITVAYAGVKLFYLFDPVWFLLDVQMYLSILGVILSNMLSKDFFEGMAFFILGSCYGEALFSSAVYSYYRPIVIGDFPFLDMLSIGIFSLLIWASFKTFAASLEHIFKKHARERQGS